MSRAAFNPHQKFCQGGHHVLCGKHPKGNFKNGEEYKYRQLRSEESALPAHLEKTIKEIPPPPVSQNKNYLIVKLLLLKLLNYSPYAK